MLRYLPPAGLVLVAGYHWHVGVPKLEAFRAVLRRSPRRWPPWKDRGISPMARAAGSPRFPLSLVERLEYSAWLRAMFQLSRRADYATRAMVHLAGMPPGAVASVATIAQEQQVPAPFLAGIATQLAASGLVQVRRGRLGGLSLIRPAGLVTLLDVIEAIEGRLRLNRCVFGAGARTDECPLVQVCPVHEVWCDVQRELVGRLRGATLARLAERGRLLRGAAVQPAAISATSTATHLAAAQPEAVGSGHPRPA